MEKKFLHLDDLASFRESHILSNDVWNIVLKWDYFAKDTVGKQFVRAVDSVSANIAEGFGRYNKKEKIHFYRYAQGSIKESEDWLRKAKERKLISDKEHETISKRLMTLPREINSLIKFTNEKLTI